jgi:uncharacterized protein (DUF342 family)
MAGNVGSEQEIRERMRRLQRECEEKEKELEFLEKELLQLAENLADATSD